MQNNQHDAAWPQEQDMTQPFEVAEDGKVRIARADEDDNAHRVLEYLILHISNTQANFLAERL
jgi:hypothetical protein